MSVDLADERDAGFAAIEQVRHANLRRGRQRSNVARMNAGIRQFCPVAVACEDKTGRG
jgi:hypothetical protein